MLICSITKKGKIMSANRVLVFVFMALFSVTSFAAEEFGIFMIVKGDVKIDTDGKKTPAKVTGKIFKGSTVETGPGGRAKIAMSDKSIVHISPESKVKIAEYSADPAKKNVKLELSHGKIRNEVEGNYNDKNKYEVKTPTAVAGVRGTDFIVNHDIKSNTTEVITFKGAVELTAFKNGMPTGMPVLVKKNEKVTASADKPIDAPVAVKADEKKQMDSDTKTNDGASSGTTPPPADTNKQKDDKKKNDGATDSTGTGRGTGKTKIGDTKDTAPESFDQLPKTNQPGPTVLPTNPNTFIPAGPNTRTNDAIRDKTDKTTVIIKPQQAPPAGSNR